MNVVKMPYSTYGSFFIVYPPEEAKSVKEEVVEPRILVENINDLTREEWEKQREANQLGGCSDLAKLLGDNKYCDPNLYFAERLGELEKQPMEERSEVRCAIGTAHEFPIRDSLKSYPPIPGLNVYEDRIMYGDGELPLCCNLDAVADVPENDMGIPVGKIGVEIKTVSPYNKDQWLEGKVPIPYYWQTTGQMMCVHELVGNLIVGSWDYTPEGRSCILQLRDARSINYLRQVCRQWVIALNGGSREIVEWGHDRWLASQTTSGAALKSYSSKYPILSEEKADLSSSIDDLKAISEDEAEKKDLKAKLKEVEKDEELHTNAVLKSMDGADNGSAYSDGTTYTVKIGKTPIRKSVNMEVLQKKYPDVAKDDEIIKESGGNASIKFASFSDDPDDE